MKGRAVPGASSCPLPQSVREGRGHSQSERAVGAVSQRGPWAQSVRLEGRGHSQSERAVGTVSQRELWTQSVRLEGRGHSQSERAVGLLIWGLSLPTPDLTAGS